MFVLISYLFLGIVYSTYDCKVEYEKLLKVHNVEHNEKKEQTFHENCNFINSHNSRADKNDADALLLKLNKFAFYTKEEYHSLLKYDVSKLKSKNNQTETISKCSSEARNVDWLAAGAVPPIKDQGQCGSCWAFSATSAIESANFINTGNMVVLSEQELVDCCVDHSEGCNGGEMNDAFEYAMKNGLHESVKYPYKAKDGSCKKLNSTSPVVKINKFLEVKEGDKECLLYSIEKYGPVSIAIDASGDVFRFYSSGVIKCDPSEKDLDHGVVAIGYHRGIFDFGSYYTVRNSWGTDWGMDGYFKLSMNENNNCGATLSASFPLVKELPCIGNSTMCP